VSARESLADLDAGLSITIFRVAQELLTNVGRHSEAQNVSMDLFLDDEGLNLRVTDDGKGIDGSWNPDVGSLGILGMRERLLQWNGRLTYSEANPRGVVARIVIPKSRLA
jgi:signal transduction histidine kinase